MQAVRRSDRLRNRLHILRTPEHVRGSASVPNLRNMGGDQFNVVNNGNIEHAQINPDIGDLVPDEQGQGDAVRFFNEEVFPTDESFLTLISTNSWIKSFAVVFVFTLILFLSDLFTTNYALESAGGYITSTPDTTAFPSHLTYAIMGLINIHYPSNPRLLIQPGTLPGQCFAFKGHHGRIRIQLAEVININAVTIEHVHQNLVEDTSSAPKDFKVYGLEAVDSEEGDELGTFTYSLDQKPLQVFYVKKTSDQNVYEHVELRILSNQGNSEYTCVYRFRVHGNKIESSDEDL